MIMDANVIWIAALVVLFGALAAVTARAIRGDRPASPPGDHWDWREDALAWNRLGIR